VPSWETLSRILEEALESYNEINAVMNLVLFEDAMHHMYASTNILPTICIVMHMEMSSKIVMMRTDSLITCTMHPLVLHFHIVMNCDYGSPL